MQETSPARPTQGDGLSVVVPFTNAPGDLVDCLTALSCQVDADVQVLVVDRLGTDLSAPIQQRFPAALFIPVPPSTTIPAMRAAGIERADKDAVAIIEDHVIVPPGWARSMLSALASSRVVGGSVENAATSSWVDWAAFLCEYSHCIPPIPAGTVTWLAGNNVAYRRSLLEPQLDLLRAGGWENQLHDAFRAAGVPLVCRPEIVVGHKKHYTLAEYLSQRYLYARSYAGLRVAGSSPLRRFATGCAAFALPPLLMYRTASRILAKRKHLGHLVRSLPLIGLFVMAWGWGEIVGYWFGPGDALSKVR